jgi:hypothetical protein
MSSTRTCRPMSDNSPSRLMAQFLFKHGKKKQVLVTHHKPSIDVPSLFSTTLLTRRVPLGSSAFPDTGFCTWRPVLHMIQCSGINEASRIPTGVRSPANLVRWDSDQNKNTCHVGHKREPALVVVLAELQGMPPHLVGLAAADKYRAKLRYG